MMIRNCSKILEQLTKIEKEITKLHTLSSEAEQAGFLDEKLAKQVLVKILNEKKESRLDS